MGTPNLSAHTNTITLRKHFPTLTISLTHEGRPDSDSNPAPLNLSLVDSASSFFFSFFRPRVTIQITSNYAGCCSLPPSLLPSLSTGTARTSNNTDHDAAAASVFAPGIVGPIYVTGTTTFDEDDANVASSHKSRELNRRCLASLSAISS